MANLDDIDLRPSGASDLNLRSPSEPPLTQETRRPSIWVALAILVALVAAVAYFIYGRQPLPPEQNIEPRAARTPAPTPPPSEPLPALDASDALIRQLVQAFSSNPQLASWLATPDLVRTFVAIVDKIAIGASPAKNAPFARPTQPFRVAGTGQSIRMDAASYARYDTLASWGYLQLFFFVCFLAADPNNPGSESLWNRD